MGRRGKRGNVNYSNPWATTSSPGDAVAIEYGRDAWRPMPTPSQPQQIGVFGAVLLNQFPAYYNQPQLLQGVEGFDSSWYTPNVNGAAGLSSNFQHTQSPSNISGAQRNAGKPGGPLGPLSSRRLSARVAAAQVRQSGLQATEWAQGLTGG
jgi:hypothetical protein